MKPDSETWEFIVSCAPCAEFCSRMEEFCAYLYETNASFNLTAIPEEQFWCKHAADSISAVKGFPALAEKKLRLCDLGCGAGFPSTVLASAFPNLEILAVDSTRKKADFVASTAERLSLKNLTALQARGNELGHKPGFASSFDLVTARAVASVEILLRESFALLKPGGTLLVYRTIEQLEEEKKFLGTFKKGIWSACAPFELPHSAGTRLFLLIKKGR